MNLSSWELEFHLVALFLLIVRNLKFNDKYFKFSKKTIQYIENLIVSM